MRPVHRVLTAIAALLLAGLYFLPMWEITLEAPQYPKGNELGVHIHVNDVRGARPNDLKNLNGLNHYIGMKEIQPDSIPELAYMPSIVAGMIAIGLIAALVGKRWLLLTWLIIVVLVGCIGIYDFYLWLYDYGHDLNPQAAIKIEGMAYQPPIIGTAQILNFTVHSFPALGFYFIIVGWIIGSYTWWVTRKVTS
jgi:copper chaperone NosL